ncbi:LOW QUALITY PROTEIN: hypothetical protein ACHAWF_014435, partial [Thalassiosira exigua]
GKAAKGAKGKATKGKGRRTKNADDSDSDDYVMGSEFKETESEMELESEDDAHAPKKGKRREGTAKAAAKKAPERSSTSSLGSGKAPRKKMSESFKPNNNPLFWNRGMSCEEIRKNLGFLDPCGMEATDDIIEGLVGEQVDTIRNLLVRALTPPDDGTVEDTRGEHGASLGSRSDPLVLGTACSGTDAPALAMTLVQEQLEKRGMGNLFHHRHAFSCEKEPFKQSYLARNFDSTLYPDIVKLCDDPPRDVYGRERPVPDFNLFVAGTSCKDFSMLRSNKRIDIEDKGCSGETFLAACESLFKKKPRYAIFENVTGAPWAKMSEYITGRINLSDCANGKKIKGASRGKDGDLEFVLEGKQIRVDRVPANYGIRCGAVVKGYSREDSIAVHQVLWPRTSKRKCTLTEVAEFNGIDRSSDILILENEVLYCTHWIKKIDTKQYGLPQTRTYMFVWQPDDDNFDDDLGEYWEAIVKYLASPVRHSLESFILEVDHDIIRTFREALNGPAGRYARRGIAQAPNFWDSKNANLPHNVNARAGIGMEEMKRTNKLPPHYWQEYSCLNTQRQLDHIEILHASAARDADSKDSNFASFFWNISQNASKEKHRSAVAGIASCITPGGDVFLPHVGRPLLGCEKLLLQVIPYFRLLLGNETEVELGDLAGNAISLTVLGATMLAAMACRQLRKDHQASLGEAIFETLERINKHDTKSLVQSEARVKSVEGRTTNTDLFQGLAELTEDAIKSSIWIYKQTLIYCMIFRCTCETSGGESKSVNFLRCNGYQLDSHDIREATFSKEERDLAGFETKLRCLMPANLVLSKEGLNEIANIEDDLHRASDIIGCVFALHRIKRDRLRWIIIYYAREDTGEAIAEFKITVGELERRRQDHAKPVVGVQGELTFHSSKKRTDRIGCRVGTGLVTNENWKAKGTAFKTIPLSLVGTTVVPSFRMEVGLTDDAADSLQKHVTGTRKKEYMAAKAHDMASERRWVYAKNWRDWPAEITVLDSSASYLNLSGKYTRAGCKHTFNQNAMWIRGETSEAPELYLMMKPDVSRVRPDVGIISTSSSHEDTISILATFPLHWQPCDTLVEEMQKVRVQTSAWSTVNNMSCLALETDFSVEAPACDLALIRMNGLSNRDINDLCCRDDDSGSEPVVHLNVHRGAKAQQTVRRFNLLCSAPFLKYAAAHGLKYDLQLDATWMPIKSKAGIPFGCCPRTIPPRPEEAWKFNEERGEWERYSEAGAARKYYLALQHSPRCFDVVANRNESSLTVNCCPEVVAHHAAFGLIDDRCGIGDELSVDFRLLSTQDDPVLERFRLHNCHDLPETLVPLKEPYELYERQRRAVTKMLQVEKGDVAFEEVEMNEQAMPGSTGWSLVARASRNTRLCGGVIADAIGSGKTVVSIAMILHGIEAARANRSFPRNSSATLVVVPPGLIDQWKMEVQKFTSAMTNVICVYDDEALGQYSLHDILEADVAICPVDMLESKGYMNRLARVAAGRSNDVKVPKLPASSRDPYGGANNPRSQQRRNESAYFTYVYNEYIIKIRQKKFKPHDKGVPLEYFEWERIIVDEIHECLCTSRDELKEAKAKNDHNSGFFQEKNRRAGREFLGIATKDLNKRPLVFRSSIFGLTATPLLDSTNRVIELANLMGNAYVVGLSNHWRNLEKESGRNIFLSNFLEPKQSREIRKTIYSKCQNYLDLACCKNKLETDMEGIELVQPSVKIRMSAEEGDLYRKSQKGINPSVQSYAITPEDFDVAAGHDVSTFLRQNAKLVCRGQKLVELCRNILSTESNKNTKIIVFADGRIGAGNIARDFLMEEEGLGCTWLGQEDSVEEKNKKTSMYGYVTEHDKRRPRVLVLHFEHSAGLNLQAECNNLILFTPLYVGEGGKSGDPVSDASTELQAIGRVFRPGQQKSKVYVYRIEVEGPDGEECLDTHLIRRNTDKETIQMAVNADD